MNTQRLVQYTLLAVAALPLAAQDVQVTAADPSAASQGTLNLNVKITGKGFKQSAQAQFFLTGTTNPGGVVVHSTTFVSPTELTANVDVPDTATIGQFDIQVVIYSTGRSGKGIDLFAVTAKGSNACTLPALDAKFTALGTLNDNVPTYQGAMGVSLRARTATLGGAQVAVAAVGFGQAWGKLEVFFLDPVTGQILDGRVLGSNTQPQPHITKVIDSTQSVGARSMAIGDVNGDGAPDIAIASGAAASAYLFVSRITGGVLDYDEFLLQPPAGASYSSYGASVAMGDLNGDGRDEIAAGASGGGKGKSFVPGKVFLFQWSGAGVAAYGTVTSPVSDSFGGNVAIGDVTGSSDADLVVRTEASGTHVFPGPSFSSFFVNPDYGFKLGAADVDGGFKDLVVCTSSVANVYSGPVAAGNAASITVAPIAGAEGGWGTSMDLGDVNGDGLADLGVGAPNNAPVASCPPSVGSAYLYLTNPLTPGQLTRYMLRPPTLDSDFGGYGYSIALVRGTRLLLVGENGRNLGGVTGAGQVYVYRVN